LPPRSDGNAVEEPRVSQSRHCCCKGFHPRFSRSFTLITNFNPDQTSFTAHTGPVRRAIILLSDGDDNQSHVTREEAIEMAQRAEVIVYTISTNLSGTGHHGDKVLERIADATGGRSYVPFQLNEVANAFAAIQEELRSQYAISYKPADFLSDGRYRSVEILALGQKGLRVRSRHGYYAPAQ